MHVHVCVDVCGCLCICIYACMWRYFKKCYLCNARRSLQSVMLTFSYLQLDIIANIAGETSIHAVLKEFKVIVCDPLTCAQN